MLGLQLIGQGYEPYPVVHDEFIERVVKELKLTKQPNYKETADRLEDDFEEGKFSEAQMDQIIELANLMVKRKMRVNLFKIYMDACLGFANNPKGEEQFEEWINILKDIYNASSKSNHTKFKNFLTFSENFFLSNSFWVSKSKNWQYQGSFLNFKFVDKEPVVILEKATLLGFVKGDSIFIKNTGGVYLPNKKLWKGKGGSIDWSRAGIDSSKAFVNFDNYELRVDKSEFTIDSALLTYLPIIPGNVYGKFTDRLSINNNPKKSKYPKFTSYRNDIKLEDIAPNVNYTGGFTLNGSDILGQNQTGDFGKVEFFETGGDLAIKAFSSTFLISKEGKINALEAVSSLYFDKDSIFHPGVKLEYDPKAGKLSLFRGEDGIVGVPFYDSYHKIEIDIDGVEWVLNQPTIDMKMIAGAGKASAFFESENLFEQKRYDRSQGYASYQPLAVMKRYVDDQDTNVLSANTLAKRLSPNLSVGQIRNLIYQLVQDGFIFYNSETQQITVKEKTINYVKNHAGKLDYDVIKIKSLTKGVNAYIDLDTNEMFMNGVYMVNLSDSQYVRFFPKDKLLIMKRNRDMSFSGTIFGGQTDVVGSGFNFTYDSFDIGLQKVSHLEMFLPKYDELDIKYAKKDEWQPVTTKVERFSGRMVIEQADNKSGRMGEKDPETDRLIPDTTYPKLVSHSNSFAYYEKDNIFDRVYQKSVFFFQLDPFVFRNLDNYEVRDVRFDGKLVSAKIFPDIPQTLVVRDSVDFSLGFKHYTTSAGLPTYGGLGNYSGLVDLSNQGLRGVGELKFQGSVSRSKDFTFFPDSMNAVVDSFQTVKDDKFPKVTNEGVSSHWQPYNDKMWVRQGKKPFQFFDSTATLKGRVLVSTKGLEGKGLMDWDEATLRSDHFVYGPDQIFADTSELNIKSIDETKVAFNLPNVKSVVDFSKQEANFKSNEDDIPTNLPYNMYTTTMNEFDWDMAKKLITFKPSPDIKYAEFKSTNKNQDGLKFKAEGGTYDLEKFLLIPTGIQNIRVADAFIIPDSSKVVIEAEAKMRTLNNAKIIVDTISQIHNIYDATVNISGLNKYRGTGLYDYTNRSGEKQTLRLQEIGVVNKPEAGFVSYGKGTVTDSIPFWMDPDIQFRGLVELNNQDKFLRFKGLAKLNIPEEDPVLSSWFKINTQVNPKAPILEVDGSKNRSNIPVMAGIARRADSTNLYGLMMHKKINRRDPEIFKAGGVLQYDHTTKEFLVGPEEKLMTNEGRGNTFTYNKQNKSYKGEGMFDFGNFGLVDFKAAGDVKKDLSDTTPYFNVSCGISFHLDEKILERMAGDMQEFLTENEDLQTDVDYLEKSLVELTSEKSEVKMLDNFYAEDQFVKPKDMEFTMILTHLKFIWDPIEQAFVSIGNGGLSYVGDKQINKLCKVRMMVRKRRSGDEFELYIETGYEDWWYIKYKRNIVEIASSEREMIIEIQKIKPEKRRIRDKKSGKFQMFNASTSSRKNKFVNKMKRYKGNF